MITLKIPYATSETNTLEINNLRKEFSSVLRFSYNRSLEKLSQKQIRESIKSLSNVSLLGSWITQCAVMEGLSIHKRNKDKKVIFGGAKTFIQRLKNQITGEEFKTKRLSPLTIQGEKIQKGNRSFDFNNLSENKLTFKVNKTNHLELELQKMNKNYRKKLIFIQERSLSKELTVTVSLNDRYVYFTYEEPKKQDISQLNKNRYVGIDLNPNFIGLSVRERIDNEDVILHTKMFNLRQLTKPITSETNSSDSVRFKYLNNKLKNETILVAKQIERLLLKYQCGFCFIEDLKDIHKANLGKGHYINRLTKNLWKRDYFVKNLTKRCQLIGCKLLKVNPMYTSVIGNLQHNFVDPVNASLEVGRRGYNVIILKNKQFYPEFRLNDLWKKQLSALESWKKVFVEVKNSKLRYRISLEECKLPFKVFKMDSVKSKVLVCKFLVEKSIQNLQLNTLYTV